MVLFNTTFHVHTNADAAFLQWIRHTYIPAALESGLLSSPLFTRIMIDSDPEAKSYALQFTAQTEHDVEMWRNGIAADHLHALSARHGESVLHFSTLMEILQP